MKKSHYLPKLEIARAFNRAVNHYDAAAHLQRLVGTKLLAQIVDSDLRVNSILEVGVGTGFLTTQLRQKIVNAQLIGVDIAENMIKKTQARLFMQPQCHFVCADADNLPFPKERFEVVIANLALQWSCDLLTTFTEFRRVLTHGGELIFSTLGPQSLIELRSSWSKVDNAIHVNHFFDLAFIKHCLLHAGFQLSYCHRENLQFFYPTVISLMQQLKALGAHNINYGRAHGLTGKLKLQQLISAYESYRQQDLPASYEVIYITAKKL